MSASIIIKPWFKTPFFHNVSVIASFYNKKDLEFKLEEKKELNLISKYKKNNLELTADEAIIKIKFIENYMHFGLDVGFNPHQNLFFGFGYYSQLSHKFELKYQEDDSLSTSGTIKATIYKTWASTYFPLWKDSKLFIKFIMEFHQDQVTLKERKTYKDINTNI